MTAERNTCQVVDGLPIGQSMTTVATTAAARSRCRRRGGRREVTARGPYRRLVALLVVLPLTGLAQEPNNLDIYWIDVEGGAATLVVTPARESVLMDTGWPRADARDALRIQAAMDDAGIDRIDYLLISHFHTDHVGGLPALAERIPIGRIVDHGDSVELGSARGEALWDEYIGLAADRRRSIVPGDKLPLERLELTFVAAHRDAGVAGRSPGHGGGRRRLAVAPNADRRRRQQHRGGADRQPDGGGRLRGALDQGDGGARRPELVDDQRPDRLQPDLSVPVTARVLAEPRSARRGSCRRGMAGFVETNAGARR